MALFSLWLIARVGLLFPAFAGGYLLPLVDMAFMPVAALILAKPLVAVKQTRNLVFVPVMLLFTIAKNMALNELRSKSRRVTSYIEECQALPEEHGPTTEEELVALEHLEAYCVGVDQLPEQCRRVYLMRKVHGMSYKDIAEHLNITVRTVERHLQKGVMRCRAHMNEKGQGVNKNQGDAQANVVALRKDRR